MTLSLGRGDRSAGRGREGGEGVYQAGEFQMSLDNIVLGPSDSLEELIGTLPPRKVVKFLHLLPP